MTVTSRTLWLYCALAATIFAVDLSLSLGVAAGIPYVALVLVASWLGARRHIYATAVASTVLIFIGYLLSSHAAVLWMVLTNRALAIFAIWVTAFFATQLKKSEERFHSIVKLLPNAVLLVNQKGRIRLGNQAAETLFGYSLAELMDQSIDFLVPQGSRSEHSAHRTGFFASPSARSMGSGRDLYGLHKGGTEVPIEIGLSPILMDEGPQVLASIIDISERKQAEEKIKTLNTRLALSNKELEAFSYSVSHDLRAPLRHIDGFSQILLEDYGDQLDAEAQDYLQRVRRGSQQMAQLIDEMLGLARITRAEMSLERVDLSQLAEEVFEGLKETEPERKVAVVCEQGLTAMGDKLLLMVVLENLIGNAWKYTGKEPQSQIEFGHAEFSEGQSSLLDSPLLDAEARAEVSSAKSTIFFVRDNGAGFDMDYSNKLFAVFQRLHGVTEFPGTGVGLATVQRIIHRHGGRIWAEGKEKGGATFYFTL